MSEIAKRGSDTPISSLNKLLLANQKQIEMVLPKHMRPERLIRLALTALHTTPALQNCSLLSIANSVMLSAQLGLEFGNGLSHAFLIPYKNICSLQIGYRGLLELAYRGGLLQDARAILVYDQEPFNYIEGSHPVFEHSPKPPSVRGEKWLAVYSRLSYADNFQSCFLMWSEEVFAIRDKCCRVKDKDGKILGPWATWEEEMIKKTCLKRHLKMEHLSSEIGTAVGLDDQSEAHSAGDNKLTRREVAQDLVLENGLVDQAIQADDELEGSRDQQQQVAQDKLIEAGQSDQWWASVKESVIKLINSKRFPVSVERDLAAEYRQRVKECPYGNAILDLKLEVEDLLKGA